MNNSKQAKWFRHWLVAGLAMVIGFASLVGSVDARRWAVGMDNQLIEAELVDFNGRQVLLKTTSNKLMEVDVRELSASDLEYLTHLVQLQ